MNITEKLRRLAGKREHKTSKYKGVDWNNQLGKWRSRITTDGRTILLGHFDDEEKAHEVYVNAKRKVL